MKSLLTLAGALLAAAALASAQESPSQTASVTIPAKTIGINYSAPSVKGREGKLFGKHGRIAKDRTYPVWRAGANAATCFHTDADLDIGPRRRRVAGGASHDRDRHGCDVVLPLQLEPGLVAAFIGNRVFERLNHTVAPRHRLL